MFERSLLSREEVTIIIIELVCFEVRICVIFAPIIIDFSVFVFECK